MQTMEIQNETRDFLVRTYLFGRSDQLNDDDPLIGKVIDSTGVLELIGFLQDRFAIQVPDEEVTPENLDSVNSITAYVARKLASGGGS